MIFRKLSAAVVTAMLLVPLATPAFAQQDGDTATILYFQDAHEPMPVLQENGDRGGWGRTATVLKREEARDPDAFTVFGGDGAGGTLFGYFRGAPNIEAFNLMGVDLASFGNHDFDFSVNETRARVSESDFPWINSNLFNPDGTPFVTPQTHVEDLGGLKVGFIGLLGGYDSAPATRELVLRDSSESITEALGQVDDVDAIVLVNQLAKADNEALLAEFPQLDVALREENSYKDEGEITTLNDGRVIVSAQGNVGTVERIELEWQGDRAVPRVTTLRVDDKVPEDPTLHALATKYQNQLDSDLAETLTTIPTPMDREEVLRVVADGVRTGLDVDLAIMNRGGARADLPADRNEDMTGAQEISLRDAYAVLPFGNRFFTHEITGQELIDLLATTGNVGIPSGFTYVSQPLEGENLEAKRTVEHVMIDGQPIDVNATYRVAASNFYFGSSDVTSSKPLKGTGTTDVELLAEYLRSGEHLDSSENRIFDEFVPSEEPEAPAQPDDGTKSPNDPAPVEDDKPIKPAPGDDKSGKPTKPSPGLPATGN